MDRASGKRAFDEGDDSAKRTGRFGGLRWRILLWTAVVAFIPLLIMASQGYHCARQAIYQSQEAHLRSVLESRKARFEAWLGEIEADLLALSSAPSIRMDCRKPRGGEKVALSNASRDLLKYVHRSNPAYERIDLLDLSLKSIARVPQETVPRHPPLEPSFKTRLNGTKGFVITPALEAPPGGIHIHVGRAVFADDGTKEAYVVAHVDISHALDPIFGNSAGLGKAGRVYLLSREGGYLYPSQFVDGNRRSYVPPAILSGKPPKALEYKNDRGRKVLGASSVVAHLGWIVVAEFDWKEAFDWLRVLKLRALATGSVTLVLVLVIAAKGANRLSGPLRELASVARKIAAGHHEERLGRLEGIEAQELSRAFNAMLDQLAASHRRLMHAASLAAVGELSSSTVHEMRNPLSSVKINLQALRKKMQSSPAHYELATIALDQVDRVEKMLRELLSYGKPLDLKPAKVLFENLAKDVLVVVQREAEEKDVCVEVGNELGQTEIIVDAEQIRRALTNLVTNAIRAAPKGGNVRLTARFADDDPEMISISVCDDGPGIPDSQKDRLFKPFFTTRPGGTGLGLANVKKIVDYHCGTVSARNRPEGGAEFIVRLPLGGPPA